MLGYDRDKPVVCRIRSYEIAKRDLKQITFFSSFRFPLQTGLKTWSSTVHLFSLIFPKPLVDFSPCNKGVRYGTSEVVRVLKAVTNLRLVTLAKPWPEESINPPTKPATTTEERRRIMRPNPPLVFHPPRNSVITVETISLSAFNLLIHPSIVFRFAQYHYVCSARVLVSSLYDTGMQKKDRNRLRESRVSHAT